jgi:hypothetical protein
MATRYKDRITILEDAEIEELYGRGPSIIPVEEKSFMGRTSRSVKPRI